MAEYKTNPPQTVVPGCKIDIPKAERKPRQFTYCANKSVSAEFCRSDFHLSISCGIFMEMRKEEIKECLCDAIDKYWEVCEDDIS